MKCPPSTTGISVMPFSTVTLGSPQVWTTHRLWNMTNHPLLCQCYHVNSPSPSLMLPRFINIVKLSMVRSGWAAIHLSANSSHECSRFTPWYSWSYLINLSICVASCSYAFFNINRTVLELCTHYWTGIITFLRKRILTQWAGQCLGEINAIFKSLYIASQWQHRLKHWHNVWTNYQPRLNTACRQS